MDLASLAARIQALEDDRAIRDLKARYLVACDGKDADGVRDTLLPDGALIDYEGLPAFTGREGFVDLFRQMACVPGIHDMHHAANGIISLTGADEAQGRWSLFFHNINLAARTVTQFGVRYEDRYVRREGRWWIAATRSWRTSCLIHTVDEAGLPRVVALGEAPARFGEG